MKPVRVSSKLIPSFLAIVSSIFDETVEDSMKVFDWSLDPLLFQHSTAHHPNTAPNSFPVNTFQFPVEEHFSATANLSASGSDARMLEEKRI